MRTVGRWRSLFTIWAVTASTARRWLSSSRSSRDSAFCRSASRISSARARSQAIAGPPQLRLAVCDERDLGSAAPEVAGRLLAHLARAEEEDRATVEAAENLLGQRGRGRRHRCRALADRCLGANLAACVQRLAEEPVEQRPCRPD